MKKAGIGDSFIAGLRFLTIFPLPTEAGHSTQALAGSLRFFPLIGLLLGVIAAGATWVLWSLFPPLLAAVFLVALLAAFSGGLHLDGLADTGDGFCSSRSREQILVIMRDSRIGAMGVIWLGLLLAVKVAALASLDKNHVVQVALLMPFAGRLSLLFFISFMNYARTEGGLADIFYKSKKNNKLFLVFYVLLFFLLASFLLGIGGGAFLLISLLFIWLSFSFLCKKIIGGITGDTLGAVCEISEAVMAVAAAGLIWSLL